MSNLLTKEPARADDGPPLWLTCLLLACFGLAMSACGVWGALAWGAAACH